MTWAGYVLAAVVAAGWAWHTRRLRRALRTSQAAAKDAEERAYVYRTNTLIGAGSPANSKGQLRRRWRRL